jgi:hypothetical protein
MGAGLTSPETASRLYVVDVVNLSWSGWATPTEDAATLRELPDRPAVTGQ